MHSLGTRRTAVDLVAQGLSLREVSRLVGVSRASVRSWVARAGDPVRSDPACFVCTGATCVAPQAYVYLLGQYLGDGHLVTDARTPKLRISCCDDYPAIAAEVDAAIRAVTGRSAGTAPSVGWTDHYSYWTHWPCLVPQHGPGRKHERLIQLEPWQQRLVADDPWALIRGLIHSDGCRCANRVVVRGKAYEYPRYFFSNRSTDIIRIFTEALDRVGVEWRMNLPWSVSVARRESVALLDQHVGPKL